MDRGAEMVGVEVQNEMTLEQILAQLQREVDAGEIFPQTGEIGSKGYNNEGVFVGFRSGPSDPPLTPKQQKTNMAWGFKPDGMGKIGGKNFGEEEPNTPICNLCGFSISCGCCNALTWLCVFIPC